MYVGSNSIAHAIVWSNEDINSFDIEYDTENELILSSEIERERFIETYNLGVFTDEQGRIPQRIKRKMLEYMRVGNYGDIMNIDDLYIEQAQRENIFFTRGVIPTVSVFDYDDIHIEEHKRFILQMKYHVLKMSKPEYAANMEQHIQNHEEQKLQKVQKEQMQQLQMQQALQAQVQGQQGGIVQ
jgi:hypothetical protein